MKKELRYLKKMERKVINSFVKELRERLGNEIVSVWIFGSRIKGDAKEDSDIDIFVLVKEKTANISEELAEITANYDLEYGLPLAPVLYDLFEYKKNKELGSFFFENVEKEGVIL